MREMFYPCGMSQTLNVNENGALKATAKPALKPASPAKPASLRGGDSHVSFQTIEGVKLRGKPGRLARQSATFELYGGNALLRTSEMLEAFQICLDGQVIYSGRATILNLLEEVGKTVGEVALDESHWTDFDLMASLQRAGGVADEFSRFVAGWGKTCRIAPEFKVVVTDMQAFLHDLRLWVDRVESQIAAAPVPDRAQLERKIAQEIGRRTSPQLTQLFEKFEASLEGIAPNSTGAHSLFAQRLLHPYLLCSPFLHRTFYKPLGYAGDYEMVNMLSRDPYEGGSLFAKIINLWFWEQPPAEAHRNRLIYLANQIEEEALRVLRGGRKAKIFNFACGPALEIQNFLKNSILCNQVSFTLADFNGETLQHTKNAMAAIKAKTGGQTAFQFQSKSVLQLLKESEKLAAQTSGAGQLYDFVYCAGLFDYLSDRTCRELMDAFYNFVAPGGLLVVTNVDSFNPRQPTMNHVMAWHLIYRNARDLAALRPSSASAEDCSITADATGVNVFLEVRKPGHA